MDVDIATFNSESELLKMKLYHPGCRLLIRLKVDDRGSVCKFSDKFGVDMTEVYDLLSYAKHMRLRVEGICFHVGSGCKNPAQYYSALKMARDVFGIAEELGLQFNIIDIGGGFPGLQDDTSMELIRGIQENVRRGLIDFFAKDFQIPGLDYQRPEDQSDDELPRLELIAEPGRFFVQSSHTLLVNIIGKKVKYVSPGTMTTSCSSPEPAAAADGAANTEIASAYNPDEAVRPTGKAKYKPEEREKVYNYYLNDGIYGSFN